MENQYGGMIGGILNILTIYYISITMCYLLNMTASVSAILTFIVLQTQKFTLNVTKQIQYNMVRPTRLSSNTLFTSLERWNEILELCQQQCHRDINNGS